MTALDGATVAGTDPLPLTQTVLGLMVVARMTGDVGQYDVTAELELDPALPGDRVRHAVASLLAVQPALRLGLHEQPTPHGRLLPAPDPDDVPFSVITAASGIEGALRGARELVGAGGFDLARPPLARFVHVAGPDRAVLLLCVHHAVFDGLSIECLVRDLNALLAGDHDVTALVPRREHALRRELDAQVRAAGAEATAEAAGHWARRLRGVTDLDLYPRPGRPADTDLRGTRHELPLDAASSAAVDTTCRALGISPFTFFSAVFGAVVARHTGADAAVLGTPVLSRRTAGGFALCGMFTTTMPLVLAIDWAAPFAEFATTTVAAETAAVKRDAAVPWNAVVEELRPSRHSSRNPGFASMIAMQDATDVPAGGAIRAVRELGNGTAKMDLWLGVTPVAGRWLLEVETDSALLPDPVTHGVLDSLASAVDRAASTPHRALRELFDDAADVDGAGAGVRGAPPAGTLRGRLDGALTGDGDPGVEDGMHQLDRAALAERVARAAAGLAARGVGRGDVVGLTTDGLADTTVAMLAVLRAGAAYLPLDADLPAERLTHMVTTAGCRLAIGPGSVPGVAGVLLEELPTLTTAAPVASVSTDGYGDDPIYVMFTSGSTGRPKGVLMGDAPLLNLTEWQVDALGLGPDTRFLQYAPLGFDVSFQEIVPVLVAGGTVVSREPADRRDMPAVARRVHDAGITHVYLPVAMLRFFTQAAADAGLDLERLRHVCVSGEQLVLDPGVREFFTDRPHLTLTNLYGPTETHAVTVQSFAAGGDWPAHAPIGRPITGVSAQVVDRTGHLAPTGVAGELLLGGRCPAEGYIGDPEQTAARFVPDPHGAAPDAVRYRTGDQVLRDDSGALVFLGRRDEQIKISGYRVELGDVEAAALALPAVRHAVAAAHGAGVDRHLLLFVVPAANDPDVPGGVRTALARTLPSYLVPREVLVVDTVPRTANGKVDRAALLAGVAELRATAVPAATLPPLTDPVLRQLERVWAEHLGRDRVHPDTSLFDQGAHSLMVLSVIAALEHEHGIHIPMLAFFQRPTLRALAAVLQEATP